MQSHGYNHVDVFTCKPAFWYCDLGACALAPTHDAAASGFNAKRVSAPHLYSAFIGHTTAFK